MGWCRFQWCCLLCQSSPSFELHISVDVLLASCTRIALALSVLSYAPRACCRRFVIAKVWASRTRCSKVDNSYIFFFASILSSSCFARSASRCALRSTHASVSPPATCASNERGAGVVDNPLPCPFPHLPFVTILP